MRVPQVKGGIFAPFSHDISCGCSKSLKEECCVPLHLLQKPKGDRSVRIDWKERVYAAQRFRFFPRRWSVGGKGACVIRWAERWMSSLRAMLYSLHVQRRSQNLCFLLFAICDLQQKCGRSVSCKEPAVLAMQWQHGYKTAPDRRSKAIYLGI